MRVKTHIPEERKRGVVYEVPCKECHQKGWWQGEEERHDRLLAEEKNRGYPHQAE